MNNNESNIIEYYNGVFDTYADIKNSITQNISYSFILEKIEPNDTNGIIKILEKNFEYKDSKIITEKIKDSEFKKLLLSWLVSSEDLSNSSQERYTNLLEDLVRNITSELKITEFLKISDSSFERNDGINQYGQLVDIAIMKNELSSYLCIFMFDG
ncbi:hypothetical protein [Psychroserpens sp. S379A]|uniref:hypothetical protein n=1 Tax=Psychroserpens sp. S379A TaxID=3415137 RepID=UPI003C7B8E02